MWTEEARLRQLRPKRTASSSFTLIDMQRWACNRRRPPEIPLQTATTAFSLIIEHAAAFGIRVVCALGESHKGKYCPAVHFVSRRDFVRVRYEMLRSVKRGGPVLAGTLYRYQQYLKHGGGRGVV